jgi:single-stranded DNA-binding protein
MANLVVLSGRLTKDAEIQIVGTRGAKKANLQIEVQNRSWDVQQQKMVDDPLTFDIEVWNQNKGVQYADQAEALAKSGSSVIVTAKLTWDRWVDKNSNQQRYKMKIDTRGGHVEFVGNDADAVESATALGGEAPF